MPTFIKTGYWDKLSKAPKGYLNLDLISGGGGGGVTIATKTEIDTLISSNSLVPGGFYEISGVDVPLYGGTTILIQAATTNTIALAGHGIFYNPKYLNSQSTYGNGYGIWTNYVFITLSNIVGQFSAGGFGPADTVTANNGATATFVSNGILIWISGDWSLATSITGDVSGATADVSGGVSPSYVIGQDVIWGGKHWTNTSGNVGAADDKYTLSSADWTAVAFNSIDYNVDIDVIYYDYEHDMIIRRKDKWNNDVDGNFQIFDEFANPNGYDYGNPIKDFQWGNGPEDWNTDDYNYIGVQSNYVKDSYFECINFIGSSIYFNTVTQQSYCVNNITDFSSYIQFNTVYNYSVIEENKLSNNSYILYNTLSNSNIEYNSLTIYSYINNNTLTNGNINYNTLTNSFANGNILSIGGEISSNLLTENGYIISNKLNSSTITSNTLNSNSYIQNNTLNSNSYIQNNTLTISSYIQNNTLTDYCNINSNTLSNSSKLEGNSLSRSYFENNLLDAGSYISFNYLNNSRFDFSSSGTLSGKAIYYITANAASALFNISTATIIYGYNYPKQIFSLPNGTIKIGYYNNSSVFTVVNVNA